MGVKSLSKTVTRQRRGCDLNPGPSAPESSTLTTQLPSHLHVGGVPVCGYLLFLLLNILVSEFIAYNSNYKLIFKITLPNINKLRPSPVFTNSAKPEFCTRCIVGKVLNWRKPSCPLSMQCKIPRYFSRPYDPLLATLHYPCQARITVSAINALQMSVHKMFNII